MSTRLEVLDQCVGRLQAITDHEVDVRTVARALVLNQSDIIAVLRNIEADLEAAGKNFDALATRTGLEYNPRKETNDS